MSLGFQIWFCVSLTCIFDTRDLRLLTYLGYKQMTYIFILWKLSTPTTAPKIVNKLALIQQSWNQSWWSQMNISVALSHPFSYKYLWLQQMWSLYSSSTRNSHYTNTSRKTFKHCNIYIYLVIKLDVIVVVWQTHVNWM